MTAKSQLNTDRIMNIGQNAMYFEDYVLSIQYFSQVIKIKPYLAEPYLMRGIAKINLGDFQGADLDISESIERNPFVPFAYYARGFARRGLEFYPEALSDFNKALEFSPNNMNYRLNIIDLKERNKDYKGALADLENYQKLNPKAINTYFDKGRILLSLNDTTGAQDSFKKYIAQDSTSSLGWSALAYIHILKDDKESAYNFYNQAIKRNSTSAGDYINRGIINVGKKKYNQALADYNMAIKLDNKNEVAYLNRAYLRANLGDNNNALSDINVVLKTDSNNYEARLQKAAIELTLRNYRNAIADYKLIIAKYEYFIPAYIGIAQAYDAMGNVKESFRYRQIASKIEQNKDYIARKTKENINNKEKIAATTHKSSTMSNNVSFFNRDAAENNDISTDNQYGTSSTRGNIQTKHTDVINEKDFILTYYAKTDELRQTNLFNAEIENYNQQHQLTTALKITNNEIPLTAEMISGHFDIISNLNATANEKKSADIYFNLAIEFTLVQDYTSAIESLNKCIELRNNFLLAYFYRAELRNKKLELQKMTNAGKPVGIDGSSILDKSTLFEVELALKDYDKVIDINSDFQFAFYNKANLLCTQKEFKSAITNYSKAIEIDKDFAEAYFNRGLTYLFIGEDAKGLADLSKAGELGIYKSYNLIQRFKKQ